MVCENFLLRQTEDKLSDTKYRSISVALIVSISLNAVQASSKNQKCLHFVLSIK